MKTSLLDYVRRQKISIEKFMKDRQIDTFNKMLIYCERFSLSPLSEKDYKEIFKVEETKKKNVTKRKAVKSSEQSQEKSGKPSKTQTNKRKRTPRKAVKDT